ncbi:MAG: 3',5'-cyclic-nucleotide phosphodiesterase [Methylacidiphilales bacterium]|nr:3',5'-cyclic-nucleotide phosphodiesterase [Candidatus Methylacidiphilales bacterium]
MSKIEVLGCSSGFCKDGGNTSCLCIDEQVLLDCGSGLEKLPLESLRKITTVILTHSHLDHILFLPLLIDLNFEVYLKKPLQVYALPETINAIKTHLLNNIIWPDFSTIPHSDEPVVKFYPLDFNQIIEIDYHAFSLHPVNHSVPAAAIHVTNQQGKSLLFSGDTAANDSIWNLINKDPSITTIIVECTFPNDQLELANISKHYCPSVLASEINTKLLAELPVYITHTRVGQEALILQELCHSLTTKIAIKLSPYQTISW